MFLKSASFVAFVLCILGCGKENQGPNKGLESVNKESEIVNQEEPNSPEAGFERHLFGCEPWEFPLTETMGKRGTIMQFASQFRGGDPKDLGLARDLKWLSDLKPEECYYGAASCPAYPFICELPAAEPLTGRIVLAALKAKHFKSKYIKTLDATHIPFPGYHPTDGNGVVNDEIHNDFSSQHIFQARHERGEKLVDEFSGIHGVLKRFVRDGQLWYVLVHIAPERVEKAWFSRYVILFAVGKSPNGNRLVGVVTHQVCHNLCD
jgi:hypothetical protein